MGIESAGAREQLFEQLAERRRALTDEQRADKIERQHGLGKLSARERIDELVDPGTFWEFGALVDATRGTPGQVLASAPADGVVTGVGEIDGRAAVVMSFDFSVFGGSNGVTGGLKVARCCEIARRDAIPMIMIMDGGGHRIQEGLDSRHFAWGFETFKEFVDLSGYVPIAAVMAGPGFAGPSNFAAFADFVVMVEGISTMGIAGPALVQAATGEDISKEDLGGARIQEELGVTDLAVATEHEALDSVRLFLSYLPPSSQHPPPVDELAPAPARADIDEIVPVDTRAAYDVGEVIEGLVDRDSVFEIKQGYARNVVTAFARIGGRAVGVVANQAMHLGGSLDSPSCEKAAHFISMCDAFGVPLVFLIDVPGFLVGTESARTQLARRSGRLMFEIGQATVPRFSVVMRKGYGAGYIAMGGGRSYAADIAVAWPTAEICAMSVEGAVDVAYRRDVEGSDDPVARRSELIDGFRENIDPFLAAEGFGLDDIIYPHETRDLLIGAITRAGHRHNGSPVPKFHAISPI